MSTEERLAQMNGWLAASKKGSSEWKICFTEAFNLLRQLNKEGAEATVERQMSGLPKDTEDAKGLGAALEGVRKTLGAYYDEAKSGGTDMVDAVTVYFNALKALNQQIKDNSKEQETAAEQAQRAADNQARHAYEQGQQMQKTAQESLTAAQTYYSYLARKST